MIKLSKGIRPAIQHLTIDTDVKHNWIPLIPPPRTLHMSFKAALSLLLFSSLGTPSDGVISPTIAVKVQNTTQN